MGEEQQPKLSGEQMVERLFKLLHLESTSVVGTQPGTVDRFVTLGTLDKAVRLYWVVWERCPEDLAAAIELLEQRRKTLRADEALAVVTHGELPQGKWDDWNGTPTSVRTYRQLVLELSGVVDAVRELVREYEKSRGASSYIRRFASTTSGERVDAIEFIKRWVSAPGTRYLGLVGPRFSGRSEVIARAAYEIGVAFGRDPERVTPLLSRGSMRRNRHIAVAEGFAVPAERILQIAESGGTTGIEPEHDTVAREDVELLKLLPPTPEDIERWFGERLEREAYDLFWRARRDSRDFMALSDAPANAHRLLEVLQHAHTISSLNIQEWIAATTVLYMDSVLNDHQGGFFGEPMIRRIGPIEDAAVEQFIKGKISSPRPFIPYLRHGTGDALSTWMNIEEGTATTQEGEADVQESGWLGSFGKQLNIVSISFVNPLVHEYFLARALAREVGARRTELLARHTFSKRVFLLLGALSPEAVAQVVAERNAEIRAQVEAEVERRLQLTLAHQLKRAVGALRVNASTVQESLEPAAAARFSREFSRIEEELSYLSALVEQTRRWHETPNGSLEGLSLHDEIATILAPLRQKQPDIHCELDVEPSLRVSATRGTLREILHGLMENAFHAAGAARTGHPSIRITACVQGETVRLDILDNGPGVHPTDRSRIFEPYVTTKKGGDQPLGTGLGLSIARRCADRIGAEIGLDPDREQTCFFVRFVAWRDIP